MEDIEVSYMTKTDVDSISKILQSEFDDFWNVNILESEILNPESIYIIAKRNNEIVGFAGIWDDTYNMHITNIAVKKSYRKKGIGSILLKKLIQITKEKSKESITLEVNELNEVAINLYLKNNFKILGKRKKYYNGVDDAIIMTMEVTNEKKWIKLQTAKKHMQARCV